jgi:hypothetical protein
MYVCIDTGVWYCIYIYLFIMHLFIYIIYIYLCICTYVYLSRSRVGPHPLLGTSGGEHLQDQICHVNASQKQPWLVRWWNGRTARSPGACRKTRQRLWSDCALFMFSRIIDVLQSHISCKTRCFSYLFQNRFMLFENPKLKLIGFSP